MSSRHLKIPLSHLASEEGDKTVWEEVERRSNAGCCTEVQLGGGDIFEPCLGESECPLWVSDVLGGSQLRIPFFPYSHGKTLHTDGRVNEGV